tara:strand:+ start:283 stop:684 length:402 start_codon:yes stop_codon:yes gene_type:complete
MKYLSEIMEKKQSDLFKKNKVFFAFGNKQFKDGMKEHNIPKDTKMTNMGQGMVCPSDNVKEVIEQLDIIYKESIKKDMKQGKNKVILRELQNHECFYVGDITDCVSKLEDYPITKEEIVKVYQENYQRITSKF